MSLTLVFVEAAIQRVPDEIKSHPQIKRYASKRHKSPDEILLDRSFHHSAMKQLSRTGRVLPEKMGRPDIIHNALLQVLETPLNWENCLKVIIHTQDGQLITINPKIRLPKNYTRFVGLIEQLFNQKRVPLDDEPLLTVEEVSLEQSITRFAPSRVIGLTRLGNPELLRNVASDIAKVPNPMVFIGAFPRGHFTAETNRLMSQTYSVDKHPLDTWIVAGRFIYEFEWSLGIAEKRLT
ncbi:MAG TPA: 16S rRNA methyltransferase [Methylomirabilota bacterium]|nr:16S rRNA methyltransferase [Methylomirabilota bacterium]